MTMYGANPEQLTALGRTMKQQIPTIETMIQTVSSALTTTVWVGPARDRFESEWNSSFRNVLQRLNMAFEMAGTDCINRSTDLARVMGSGT